MFYIFGKETKVVNDISGYRSDDPNDIINIGSACVPYLLPTLNR